MAARIRCPHCDATFRVSDEKVSKKLRCTSCRESFTAEEAAPPKGRRGKAKLPEWLTSPGVLFGGVALITAIVLYSIRDRLFRFDGSKQLPVAEAPLKKPDPPPVPKAPPPFEAPAGWKAESVKFAFVAAPERTCELKLFALPKNNPPVHLAATLLESSVSSEPGFFRLIPGSIALRQVRFGATTEATMAGDSGLRLWVPTYRFDEFGNLKGRTDPPSLPSAKTESKAAALLAAGIYEFSKLPAPNRVVKLGETWTARTMTHGVLPQLGESLEAEWTCMHQGTREAAGKIEAFVQLEAVLKGTGGRVVGKARGEGVFAADLGAFSRVSAGFGVQDGESGAERKWELNLERAAGNPKKIGVPSPQPQGPVRGTVILQANGVVTPLDPQLVERREVRHKFLPVKIRSDRAYDIRVENIGTPTTGTFFPVINVLDPKGKVFRSSDSPNGANRNTLVRLEFQTAVPGLYAISIGSRESVPGAFVVYVGEFEPTETPKVGD